MAVADYPVPTTSFGLSAFHRNFPSCSADDNNIFFPRKPSCPIYPAASTVLPSAIVAPQPYRPSAAHAHQHYCSSTGTSPTLSPPLQPQPTRHRHRQPHHRYLRHNCLVISHIEPEEVEAEVDSHFSRSLSQSAPPATAYTGPDIDWGLTQRVPQEISETMRTPGTVEFIRAERKTSIPDLPYNFFYNAGRVHGARWPPSYMSWSSPASSNGPGLSSPLVGNLPSSEEALYPGNSLLGKRPSTTTSVPSSNTSTNYPHCKRKKSYQSAVAPYPSSAAAGTCSLSQGGFEQTAWQVQYQTAAFRCLNPQNDQATASSIYGASPYENPWSAAAAAALYGTQSHYPLGAFTSNQSGHGEGFLTDRVIEGSDIWT